MIVTHETDICHKCCTLQNGNVTVIRYSTFIALEVIILTTFCAASDENFVKMMTFPFQWLSSHSVVKTDQVSEARVLYWSMKLMKNVGRASMCWLGSLYVTWSTGQPTPVSDRGYYGVRLSTPPVLYISIGSLLGTDQIICSISRQLNCVHVAVVAARYV